MNKNKLKRYHRFILIFILSFSVCITITGTYIYNRMQLEYAKMEQMIMTETNKVSNVLTKLLYKTQVLAALVIQNDGQVEDFERVAAQIADDPCIKNVIIAPDGIVSQVYPIQGNEDVIGFDYFSEKDGNQEAIAAKNSGQLVLGGPFSLIQGGQALVGRYPVFIKNQSQTEDFWGLVSVTLNYPQALDGAELEQLKNQGFAYEIWRISPDTNKKQLISHSNYSYNKESRYVERKMGILNAEWYFKLSPIKNWYEYPETWIFAVLSILISLSIAFLVLHNYDLKLIKKELEEISMNDPLTGILNRRGIFQYLERLMAEKQCKFVLCYMDINEFKQINDTFGHNMGDMILQEFVEVFKHFTDKRHILGRMGGDEFILVFQDTDKKEEVSDFLIQVNQLLSEREMEGKHKKIPIMYSIGMAVYPTDGITLDDVIAIADSAMYENKMNLKESCHTIETE